MATVTGLTAERMAEIQDQIITGAGIVDGMLVLIRHDGQIIEAGAVGGVAGPPGQGVEFLDNAESSAGLPDGTKICRRYP